MQLLGTLAAKDGCRFVRRAQLYLQEGSGRGGRLIITTTRQRTDSRDINTGRLLYQDKTCRLYVIITVMLVDLSTTWKKRQDRTVMRSCVLIRRLQV